MLFIIVNVLVAFVVIVAIIVAFVAKAILEAKAILKVEAEAKAEVKAKAEAIAILEAEVAFWVQEARKATWAWSRRSPDQSEFGRAFEPAVSELSVGGTSRQDRAQAAKAMSRAIKALLS